MHVKLHIVREMHIVLRWFLGFDWEGLRDRKLKAPLVQPVANDLDLSNFEKYPKDKLPPDETSGWDLDFWNVGFLRFSSQFVVGNKYSPMLLETNWTVVLKLCQLKGGLCATILLVFLCHRLLLLFLYLALT